MRNSIGTTCVCQEMFNIICKKHNINLSFFQSNVEGEIVNEIQNARNKQNCIIINAGGYTHTSVAIHDALKILKISSLLLIIFL